VPKKENLINSKGIHPLGNEDKKETPSEHQLQKSCVEWFGLQYPKLQRNLMAIPNGAKRDPRSGRWYKEEGMRAGAPDLILLVPSKDYHTLCIEMKTEKGRLSASQVLMEVELSNHNNKYVVCRCLDDFMNEINNYIQEK